MPPRGRIDRSTIHHLLGAVGCSRRRTSTDRAITAAPRHLDVAIRPEDDIRWLQVPVHDAGSCAASSASAIWIPTCRASSMASGPCASRASRISRRDRSRVKSCPARPRVQRRDRVSYRELDTPLPFRLRPGSPSRNMGRGPRQAAWQATIILPSRPTATPVARTARVPC